MLQAEVAFDAQAYEKMDEAEGEAPDQQLHRLFERDQPDGRDGDLLMEEYPGNHGDRVAEVAPEHHAPEGGGDAAPEEHGEHLLHALAHIRVLPRDDEGPEGHHQAVAGVRQHQAEEEVVEDRHDGSGVDLALAGHPVGGDDSLGRRREGVVFEKDRCGLVFPDGRKLHDAREFGLKLLLHLVGVLLGEESPEDEDPFGGEHLAEGFLAFRLQDVVVMAEAQEIADGGFFLQRPGEVFFGLPDLGKFRFQSGDLFRGRFAGSCERPGKAFLAQGVFQGGDLFPGRQDHEAGLGGFGGDDLGLMKLRTGRISPQRFFHALGGPEAGQRADEGAAAFRAGIIQGNRQLFPGDQCFPKGGKARPAGRLFGQILLEGLDLLRFGDGRLFPGAPGFPVRGGEGIPAFQGGEESCLFFGVVVQNVQGLHHQLSGLFAAAFLLGEFRRGKARIFRCFGGEMQPALLLKNLKDSVPVIFQSAEQEFLHRYDRHR